MKIFINTHINLVPIMLRCKFKPFLKPKQYLNYYNFYYLVFIIVGFFYFFVKILVIYFFLFCQLYFSIFL